MRPRALIVLLAALAALAAMPSSAGALAIGIGDQKAHMFSDPRFKALGIKYARRSVAWDALESSWQADELSTWLAGARSLGVAPLVSFDHSRVLGRHRVLPSTGQFAHEFRSFHARFPWVTDFASWNEANYCGEPTCHKPALVASYYRQMRHYCPSCKLLGAELLDQPNMALWVRQFRAANGGRDARLWGLHNYIGANRLQTRSTQGLLGATRAQIWFTETGGLVSRHNKSTVQFRESAPHAASVTRFVFDRLARLSARVTRVYIYQWDSGGLDQAWDSGLIDAAGRPRAAYDVFVAELRSHGDLPAGYLAPPPATPAPAFGPAPGAGQLPPLSG